VNAQRKEAELDGWDAAFFERLTEGELFDLFGVSLAILSICFSVVRLPHASSLVLAVCEVPQLSYGGSLSYVGSKSCSGLECGRFSPHLRHRWRLHARGGGHDQEGLQLGQRRHDRLSNGSSTLSHIYIFCCNFVHVSFLCNNSLYPTIKSTKLRPLIRQKKTGNDGRRLCVGCL